MYLTPKKLKKINIMGHQVTVIIDGDKLERDGDLGSFVGDTITLRDVYETRDDFIDTFCHECFHALCWVLGSQLDEHMEEVLANTAGQTFVRIVSKLLSLGELDELE